MNFSQYLRLDEGNYGHDVDKKRVPTGKTVTDLDGEPMLDPVTGKPLDADGPVEDEKKVQLDWQIPSLKEAYTPPEGWRELTAAEKENSRNVTADMARMEAGKEQMKYAEKERQRAQDKRSALIKKEEAAAAAKKPENEENTDSSGVRGESLQDWNAPLHEENEERPYNYGRDEDDEGYKPSRADKARAKKRREGMAASGIDENVVKALKQAWKGDRNPSNTDDAVIAGTLAGTGPVLAATGNPNLAAGAGLAVGGVALGRNITQTVRGARKRIERAKAMNAAKAPKEESVNDSLEIPMRDALGRLSIYSIAEGVAHMKRQLKSKNITATEKRKIQQRLHDKETRDRPRQLARAGDSKTPLDIAVNAADRASESVTPAPKKQRVSTPAETADHKENAPKWVKKMSEEERLARAANDAAEGEYRSGGEGTPRQKHLDK